MILLQELTSLCGVLPLQQWLLQFSTRDNRELGTSALFPPVRYNENQSGNENTNERKNLNEKNRENNSMSVSFQLSKGKEI